MGSPYDLEKIAFQKYQQAVAAFNEGRQFKDLLRESRTLRLDSWMQRGLIKRVRISAGDPQRCERCRHIDRKEFDIGDAYHQQPLPDPLCNRSSWRSEPMCVCSFVAIVPGWRGSDPDAE